MVGRTLAREVPLPKGIPFYLALPAQDCLLKALSLPDMDLQEVRSALYWNFESYFPYPRDQATFDVISLALPETPKGEMGCLAAVVMTEKVLPLLQALSKGDFVDAVEPVNLSMCRALTAPDERGLSLLVIADGSQLYTVLRYHSQGIFFRAADFQDWDRLDNAQRQGLLAEECRRTLDFVATKYGPTALISVATVGIDRDQWLRECLRGQELGLRQVRPTDFWPLEFVPPADPSWFDLAGLLLREVDRGEL